MVQHCVSQRLHLHLSCPSHLASAGMVVVVVAVDLANMVDIALLQVGSHMASVGHMLAVVGVVAAYVVASVLLPVRVPVPSSSQDFFAWSSHPSWVAVEQGWRHAVVVEVVPVADVVGRIVDAVVDSWADRVADADGLEAVDVDVDVDVAAGVDPSLAPSYVASYQREEQGTYHWHGPCHA